MPEKPRDPDDRERSLSTSLAYQHAAPDISSSHLSKGNEEDLREFGSPKKLSRRIAECKRVIGGFQKEADLFVKRNTQMTP